MTSDPAFSAIPNDLRVERVKLAELKTDPRHARVHKALKGDVRAANVVLQLVAKVITPTEDVAAPVDAVSADELAIMESFIARHAGGNGDPPEA